MVILKGFPFLVAKISNSRLVPDHYEQREIWHKPTGAIVPLWIRKLVREDKTKEFGMPEGDVIHITLPTHTKETDGCSPNEVVGVRLQIVEVPHDKLYDV